ncbi:hypothetical protein M409DRAFT_60789 [Zasmidium cellare ATCC 36951]|uniref:Uncharacterized protein n=1 Tax=Zasmidium cellare ATCC 36951 TaxID=1080233 RepID=A0A6A6BZX1_ZASCE|nr:uncharacterized protein M409DRAFT_60789 [Zasmidium cellare ATCC 36951]KAF2159440.1 hypothetical protein M409DRAFT_60789 [Zasmidium cellare ATCC 36951]
MDLSPSHRHRQTPSGPRHPQSLTEAQMPRTSQSAYIATPTQEEGYPEMVQISNRSALVPSTSMRHSRSRQTAPASHHSAQPTVRAVPEAESAIAVNYHPPSSPALSRPRYTSYPDRDYPHAPPPARHRSRSPANSPPPASRMEAQSTTTSHSHRQPPSTTSTSQQQRRTESSHTRTPFQPAQAYHGQRQQDPHRLLPTTGGAPRCFSFELAPANNEFVYTPPRTSDNEIISSDQNRRPQFRPVLRSVPDTVRDVSADHLALIFARPAAFDESRRVPENLPEDPNIRQEFAEGFIYETGVDYETVEGNIPSSPPVFDQYMLFEEGRMETDEGHSTTRRVSEDDAGDFSQVEMPGMWR